MVEIESSIAKKLSVGLFREMDRPGSLETSMLKVRSPPDQKPSLVSVSAIVNQIMMHSIVSYYVTVSQDTKSTNFGYY